MSMPHYYDLPPIVQPPTVSRRHTLETKGDCTTPQKETTSYNNAMIPRRSLPSDRTNTFSSTSAVSPTSDESTIQRTLIFGSIRPPHYQRNFMNQNRQQTSDSFFLPRRHGRYGGDVLQQPLEPPHSKFRPHTHNNAMVGAINPAAAASSRFAIPGFFMIVWLFCAWILMKISIYVFSFQSKPNKTNNNTKVLDVMETIPEESMASTDSPTSQTNATVWNIHYFNILMINFAARQKKN